MAVHSERAEEVSVDDFLELGWPCRMQSEKEQELESAIHVGLGSERDLDWEFNIPAHRAMEQEFEMREECCE
jgi:hypothetical protein